MKYVLALLLVCGVALAMPALAAEEHSNMKHTAKGEVTAWDAAAKTFTVKEHNGKEVSFSWTDKTTVTGAPKVGVMVDVEFKYGPDGKSRVAEKINVMVAKK